MQTESCITASKHSRKCQCTEVPWCDLGKGFAGPKSVPPGGTCSGASMRKTNKRPRIRARQAGPEQVPTKKHPTVLAGSFPPNTGNPPCFRKSRPPAARRCRTCTSCHPNVSRCEGPTCNDSCELQSGRPLRSPGQRWHLVSER